MRVDTLAGIRTNPEPVRSTAYYYGDLERNKRKDTLTKTLGPQVTTIEGIRCPEGLKGEADQLKGICCEGFQWKDLENRSHDPVASLTERLKSKKLNDVDVDLKVGLFDRPNYFCLSDPLRRKERSAKPPDLGRLKRKNFLESGAHTIDNPGDPNALSEYVECNGVSGEGPVREVPPLRDRQRSLPEYSTPENSRKFDAFPRSPTDFPSPETSRRVLGETYSTAGTFPMRETKEKEPLLAELEVVGRVPLSQLEASGVRRSRSWYLCCPEAADEDMSRESSWRYSSLRPVTAPPPPGQNGLRLATSLSSDPGASPLRAERDSLARALAVERARSAAAARAHDARLAELHGVIAELVRRRAHDKQAKAIPEEELSEECESSTQQCGEQEPDDAEPSLSLLGENDQSLTELNETSSMRSAECDGGAGAEAEAGAEAGAGAGAGAAGDTGKGDRAEPQGSSEQGDTSASLDLSQRDCDHCARHTNARCCQSRRRAPRSPGGCDPDPDPDLDLDPDGDTDGVRLYPASPGRCESRQAKVASRVRLKRTEHTDADCHARGGEQCLCAERLALDVCAQADYREALAAAEHHGASVAVWRARCGRLQADCRVLRCALARATDTAHRLSVWRAAQESAVVAVCGALRAADRALEAYDVLLALAETRGEPHTKERAAAERVANQLLARLEGRGGEGRHGEEGGGAGGEPLLSPGPWMEHDAHAEGSAAWTEALEAALRAHAARLKADTVTLRAHRPPPKLFSYHDTEECDDPTAGASMAEMETAVRLQEALALQEARALTHTNSHTSTHTNTNTHTQSTRRSDQKSDSLRARRHWLDAASETDL